MTFIPVIPLSAWSCLGRWEFGGISRAAGQNDGTWKSKSIQPSNATTRFTLYLQRGKVRAGGRGEWRKFLSGGAERGGMKREDAARYPIGPRYRRRRGRRRRRALLHLFTCIIVIMMLGVSGVKCGSAHRIALHECMRVHLPALKNTASRESPCRYVSGGRAGRIASESASFKGSAKAIHIIMQRRMRRIPYSSTCCHHARPTSCVKSNLPLNFVTVQNPDFETAKL